MNPETCAANAPLKLEGGEQTRSFMYAADCIKGIQPIMGSHMLELINLDPRKVVSINQLVEIIEGMAGIKLQRNHNLSAPEA